jgi:uncharacterized protein
MNANSSLLRSSLRPALVVGALLLAACSSLIPPATPDLTRYYVLTSGEPAATTAPASAPKLQIGLRAVEVPGYLRVTKSLLVRASPNEIRQQDDARWAEPLESALTRTLRERLLNAPDIAGVSTNPMPSSVRRDADLVVRVLRCEGEETGGSHAARLTAVYELLAADGSGRSLLRKTFTARDAAWDGKDFGALAGLLSRAVGELADQIAADLRATPPAP